MLPLHYICKERNQMDEFTDIYRIYAKNCAINIYEEDWEKEDIALLKEKLDKVGPLIENGDLIINTLKRDINDNCDCSSFVTALEHVTRTLLEIEGRVKESQGKDDQSGTQDLEPTIEINKEIDKKQEVEPEVKLEVKPEIIPQDKISDQFSIPFKEALHRYRNASIYKEVYDHLLETLPSKFNYKNVYDSIDSIYKEKTKRELKHKTLQTYAGRYIEYMEMNEKIEIDKKSGMFVKIIKKEIIEAPEKQKPQDLHGKRKGIFSKDQVLAKYRTVYIYKPIVDEIMNDADLPDEFTRKDLFQFIFNYYNFVLKKKISLGSSCTYGGKYVKYLIENKMIEEGFSEAGVPNKLIKIKDGKPKEEPPEKEDKKEPTDEKPKITIKGVDDAEKPEIVKEEIQQQVSFADGKTLPGLIQTLAEDSFLLPVA